MNARLIRRFAALALLAAVSGCGGNGLVSASGRLTYKGQPVPSTQLTFLPADGSRASHGVTDDSGNFSLTFSRTLTGVKPGAHTVVLKYDVSMEEELGQIQPKASKELKAVIARYGDAAKTPLHFEITKGGQFIEINLE